MAKKVVKQVKLQVPAGKANPAPPIGPALGQAGINIGDFVNKFNEATKDKMGSIIPVVISVYDDRSYDFICKTPPASNLILKKLGKDKGSGKNITTKVGTLTQKQIEEIATEKMPDLNTDSLESAAKIIAGTARSMGVEIKN
jgi:large subunit ribosomal protein L11